MSDVLVHLEEMRKANARAPRLAAPSEAPPALEPPTAPVPPAPQRHAPPVVPMPAAPPVEILEPPTAASAPQPKPALPAAVRRPLDPNLPPDTPLEPGSGSRAASLVPRLLASRRLKRRWATLARRWEKSAASRRQLQQRVAPR